MARKSPAGGGINRLGNRLLERGHLEAADRSLDNEEGLTEMLRCKTTDAAARAGRDTAADPGRALEERSAELRALVERTCFRGDTCRVIATLVGCPGDTVRTRMVDARLRLKPRLADGAEVPA